MVLAITVSGVFLAGNDWIRGCFQKLRELASAVQNFVIRIFRGVIPSSKKLEMGLLTDETMIRLATAQMGESFRQYHTEMEREIRQIGKEYSVRFAKEEIERNRKLRRQFQAEIDSTSPRLRRFDKKIF